MINEFFMKKVFELAAKGRGHVSPNPLVGAILVKDDQIIAEGFHHKYETTPVEVNAFNEALSRGINPEGATLFCNLEPSASTSLIIQSKIKKIVIANYNPNTLLNGGGIEFLKNAGIEVTIGVMEEFGTIFNEIYFKYIQTKTPFVHLKMGQTLDGKIATSIGRSKYVTAELSLRRVHEYR